jgi:hypothetical protein
MYSPAHHDNDIVTFGKYEGRTCREVYYSSQYNNYVELVLKIEKPVGRMSELQMYFAGNRGFMRMPNGTYKCCLEIVWDYIDRMRAAPLAQPPAPLAQPPAPHAVRMGRPTCPIVCPNCNKVFTDKHAKYNHKRRGKCIVTQASV